MQEPEHRPVSPPAELIAAGNALLADAATTEAFATLRTQGISPILLRGPVVTHHLYGAAEVRAYADADLLVDAPQRPGAEVVLRSLGYEHSAVLGQRASDRPPWSSTWIRSRDGATVDLHWALVGTRCEAGELWHVLRGEIEPLVVLAERLDGLNVQATALIVALHAAHHGAGLRRPLDDLQRALDRVPLDTWERARELAERLAATEAFAAGLRLLEDGATLADELGLPASYSVETALRAESAPPLSLGFEWLARTPGLRRKVLFVAGKILPDREFMRAWSTLARNGGRTGLALAYAWRPIWLISHSVPGLRAWLRARRRSSRTRPTPRR